MKTHASRAEHLRRVFAIVAVIVTVYYLYWRITETFNPNALVFSWALWVAEVFGAFSTFLLYFVVWKQKERTTPEPLPGRTVDVFIPTVNESVDVLRKTLLACNNLKYPHRTIVLDDGNRREVRDLCGELGCIHLARSSHKHAKAGNLNFGLEHSEAEFVAVFDADHAPLPHFLDQLLGYFRDDEVAFVQTPQEYYNIDSFQHRVDAKKKYIWAEQYLFYSLIQPGRDHWKAAYFVGSCAIIRRKALDDIGGFAHESVTEDLLTSVRIHSKGWSSVYHNEVLAYGIAAETIHPFQIQRMRWGIGSWQVFFRANPLFMRGMSFAQRLCYLESLIYPLEGFQKLIFYATPPIALITGILPMRALDINYLLHFIPYYTISLFAFNEMSRGVGGNLLLEQFSMGKFVTYIGTLGAFLFSRKSKQFKVTPKGQRSLAPYRLLIPQIVVCIISIVAIVWALVELILQLRNDDFIIVVNSLWALYNSGLAIGIILYARKKLFQRRKIFRIPDSLPVRYSYSGRGRDSGRYAVIDNMTRYGISLFSIGRVPDDRVVRLTVLLPKKEVSIDCVFLHGKTVAAANHLISRTGLRFVNIDTTARDELSHYLHEGALVKFLREYSKRYRTFLERQLEEHRRRKRRARRHYANLPVALSSGNNRLSIGVIRNISSTGVLLAAQENYRPEEQVQLVVAPETGNIRLMGTVVRTVRHQSENYPEYYAGIRLSEPDSERVKYILQLAHKAKALYHE
ncbi:MAG: glycosyltransferase [bacterium]|nr:MAG: glycosyltransferase [bacterium]